jgi:hypothetical protein
MRGNMRGQLFFRSFFDVWENVKRRAVADVGNLERGLFSDPRLGGQLQEIVQNYDIEIARLNTDPKAIIADAVEEERVVDDYGMRRAVKIKRLQVTVPFIGDADTLRIMPSRSTMMSHAVDVGQNSISFTIADDDRADGEVTDICKTIQGNLDQLRQDYQQYKPQLEEAVSHAAERRKAEIAAEGQRDTQHRAFTVRRG